MAKDSMFGVRMSLSILSFICFILSIAYGPFHIWPGIDASPAAAASFFLSGIAGLGFASVITAIIRLRLAVEKSDSSLGKSA